LTGFNTI